MKVIRFNALFDSLTWISPAYVILDNSGNIVAITNHPPEEKLPLENVDGIAIPGFPNAHSHTFQYAMAGLAEYGKDIRPEDDFWTWRKHMYNVALQLDPDEFEAVAAMAYCQMLKAGYTQVSEFHYLHHDQNGEKFNHTAEMAERVLRAGQQSGMKINIIPIFYQKGGFNIEPQFQQRRFISKNYEDYQLLWENTHKLLSDYPSSTISYGIHSLRAVDHEQVTTLINSLGNSPIHIHVSEQILEVEQCIEHLGFRPVEWLAKQVGLDHRFYLVHATHCNTGELKQISEQNANVVLCPTTEANLGDGIFPLREFIALNGRWCIGSDSHISVDPIEEVRLVDYGQRLISHRRNTFNQSMENVLGNMVECGSKAENVNLKTVGLKVGNAFDAVIFDSRDPLLSETSIQYILPTLIYSSPTPKKLGTMINGDWVVQEGIHNSEIEIESSFKMAMQSLGIRKTK